MRRLFLPAVLALGLAAAAHAKTVAVLPSEDPGLPAPELTQALVEGAMDGLFDSGLVATGARTAALDFPSWQGKEPDLAEAREGRIDYLLELFVAYAPAASQDKALLPSRLEYVLLRARDGKRILSGSSSLPADRPETVAKIADILRGLGSAIARSSVAAIEEDSGPSASSLGLLPGAPLAALTPLSAFGGKHE